MTRGKSSSGDEQLILSPGEAEGEAKGAEH